MTDLTSKTVSPSSSAFSAPSLYVSLPPSQGNSVGITGPDETTLTVSVNPSLINVIPSEVTSQTSGLTPSKRARGKSVSVPASAVTPAHILRSSITPTIPGTTDKILNNLVGEGSETSASVTLSQALVLTRSPVSPHRAKPRKGVFGEFSSECSETSSVDSNLGGSSGDCVCIPRSPHRLQMLDNTSRMGPQSPDTGSLRTESDHVIAETGSAAGSTITEPGSSARSDSISDSSNSDIEIYLETHGLNDSAIRMNCVGQQPSAEADNPRRLNAESPVLSPSSSHALNEVNQDVTLLPPSQLRLEPEGWVSASLIVPQSGNHGTMPPAAQHGESLRLQAEAQESGNYGVLNRPPEKFHGQDTTNYGLIDQSSSGEFLTTKDGRAASALKPTSVDFKPRMAVELKPPHVEFKPIMAEFNTAEVGLTPNQPSANRVQLSAPRAPFLRRDVDDSFQSNRAIATPSQTRGRPDDTVYLDQLRSLVSRDIVSDPSLENHLHIPEDPQQQPSFDDSSRTPNVYINGLPPHFPEDELYALTAPFGEVKSVRTFTRHVRDSESGYGFVLFEDIESAERCIIALRKYRNLHPTFSKQIHKIPGTIYAQSFAHSPSTSMNSFESWDSKREETDNFKRRMESLHDPTSTNLYMEGLPLSIDEPTLAALVSPHRISSSRFFQTRLSHPPRIIAFVRLETRAGAEEIIERLHGRMVRGWNDTGSRISVRFADTAEQRELRRTERVTKEGDNVASRLTIAQAALLNLRGQELRQAAKISTLPVIGERRRHTTPDYPYNDFSSNSIQLPAPRPAFEVDYSLAPGRAVPLQRMHSPGLNLAGYSQQYSRPAMQGVDPSMTIVVDNLRDHNSSLRGSNAVHYDTYSHHNLAMQSQQSQQYLTDEYALRPPPVHAKSGYTATEEYIMRAHAESRHRSAPLDIALQAKNCRETEIEVPAASIATGVRGYRTRAAAISLDRKTQSSTLSEIEPVSIMNEDEFHAAATRGHDDRSQVPIQGIGEQDPDMTVRGSSNTRNAQVTRQPSRPFHTPVLPPNAQFNSVTVTDQRHNQHVRSTTFPHRPTPTQHQRHQQHSSMSVPGTGPRTPQHAATAVMGQSSHDKHDYQENLEKQTLRREFGNKLHSKLQHGSNLTSLNQNSYDMDNQPSPSLISPTLTYSSQTPSTLSPATPFFGSFNSQNEGFDRNNGFEGKKVRVGGH